MHVYIHIRMDNGSNVFIKQEGQSTGCVGGNY